MIVRSAGIGGSGGGGGTQSSHVNIPLDAATTVGTQIDKGTVSGTSTERFQSDTATSGKNIQMPDGSRIAIDTVVVINPKGRQGTINRLFDFSHHGTQIDGGW